jgi:hypothetical protein
MLVMRRQAGQSIAIGECMMLTLSFVGRDFVDFDMRTEQRQDSTLVTFRLGRMTPISEGVSGTFIRSGSHGALIGFEYASHIAIERRDTTTWQSADASH